MIEKAIGLVALMAMAIIGFVFFWSVAFFIMIVAIGSCLLAGIVMGLMAVLEWNDKRIARRLMEDLRGNPPAG